MNDFTLGPDDGAIVIRANGEAEVYLPSSESLDDEVDATSSTVEIAKLAIAHKDEEVRALLDKKLYEE